MKKFFGLLALSLALLFAFSCSMFDETDNSGSVSFELSSDIIKNIEAHKSARDAWGSAEGDDDDDGDWGDGSQYQEKYIVEIKLSGSYTAQKSVEMTSEKQSITFEKIPIGSSVKADAVFYEVTTLHGNEVKTAWLKGSSDTIKVKQGSNTLKISLKYIYGEVPVTFTLTFKNQSDRPSSLANGAYSVIAYKAGSSSVSQFYNKFVAGDGNATEYATFIGETDGEDILGYGAWGLDPSNTATVNENAGAIILTGSMEMVLEEKAVFIVTASFQGPSGSGAVLPQSYIFAGYADNVTSLDALNASAIDVTGGEISASLKLARVPAFTNSMYSFYEKVSDGYNFYMENSAASIDKTNHKLWTQPFSTNSFAIDSKSAYYFFDYSNSQNTIYIFNNISGSMIGGGYPVVTSGSQLTGALTAIAVDKTTDVVYGTDGNIVYKFAYSNSQFTIADYCSGATTTTCLAVNNGVAYIPFISSSQIKLKVLPFGDNSHEETLTCNEIPSTAITSNSTITDITYHNGYLYILLNELVTNSTNRYYSRGALIRVNPSDYSCTAIGFAPDTGLRNFRAACKIGGQKAYNSQSTTDYYSETFGSTDPNTSPIYNVHAPYNDSASYFAGPEKIIAIKPKKLVVSDTGYIFYTLADGIFRCHKVDRVVEIDLENLSMANTVKNDVAVEFKTITGKPNFSSINNTYSVTCTYYTESAGVFTPDSLSDSNTQRKAYIVEE